MPVRIAHSHSTSGQGELVRNLIKKMLKPTVRIFPTHCAACTHHAGRWLFGNQLDTQGAVRIIPNAIDIDLFRANSEDRQCLRREIGAGSDSFVVGWVGRLVEQKNPLFALEIFARIRESHPHALLVVVGDGPLRDRFARKIATLGLDDAVKVMGTCSPTAAWYSAFDVLLFPSRYEGLGMVAIEAQAAALPVVMSDAVPDNARIVNDLVQIISLDEGVDEWASAVDRSVRSLDWEHRVACETESELIAAGYSDHEAAQSLAEWYVGLAGGEER